MSLVGEYLTVHLGNYHTRVDSAVREIVDHRIIERCWESDATLRQPDAIDIGRDSGWLQHAGAFHDAERWHRFARDVHAEGYTQAVILGTGGTGLAPAFFSHLHDVDQSALPLAGLDSAD